MTIFFGLTSAGVLRTTLLQWKRLILKGWVRMMIFYSNNNFYCNLTVSIATPCLSFNSTSGIPGPIEN